MSAKNVLGTDLKSCSCDPMTGWYRDGSCRTDMSDQGIHTVCAACAISIPSSHRIATTRFKLST